MITSGTGKTHLVEALAHAAIDTGRRVAWFTLESLTAAVGRAGADGSVARTITKITRADLIMPKTLATATVDRLLHHAHIVLTEGTSLRLAEATAGKGVIPLS